MIHSSKTTTYFNFDTKFSFCSVLWSNHGLSSQTDANDFILFSLYCTKLFQCSVHVHSARTIQTTNNYISLLWKFAVISHVQSIHYLYLYAHSLLQYYFANIFTNELLSRSIHWHVVSFPLFYFLAQQ